MACLELTIDNEIFICNKIMAGHPALTARGAMEEHPALTARGAMEEHPALTARGDKVSLVSLCRSVHVIPAIRH
jgi:hypothetical protein